VANERQFRLQTIFVATRGVQEYRATIDQVITPDDVVLELGCEWGSTTRIIADRCREVVGTDMSPDCIEHARSLHARIRFEVLDAFDLSGALALQRPFNKIYIDLSGFSGYRSLLDSIPSYSFMPTFFARKRLFSKAERSSISPRTASPGVGVGFSYDGLLKDPSYHC
jgi:hypothetical protein